MDLNLLSIDELSKLKSLVECSNNICICCHKSPDGDALGSSLSLAEWVKWRGKKVTVVIPDAYPDYLRWLPNCEKVVRFDKHADSATELLNNSDLIFCLDFNDSSRLSGMQEAFDATTCNKIMIDHHMMPLLNCHLAVSRPEMSSTSEVVFRLIWQMGEYDAMSKHFATCIYTGMMTDTGAFTYNSCCPEIYFIISQLLLKNIDKDKIYRKVYNNYSSWCIRFRGYVMYQKLNVLEDYHSCYFTITREDMRRFHFVKGDAEGLVNEPLRIKNMRLSISMREDTEKENKIWISLRSVEPYRCDVLAREFFNGGGHPNASGGSLDCSMEEAEQKTRAAIKHFFETNT